MRVLLCAVIERAVDDRRWADARGLLDAEANTLPRYHQKVKADRYGPWVALNYFFHGGGLETICEIGELELPIEDIKRASKEQKKNDDKC